MKTKNLTFAVLCLILSTLYACSKNLAPPPIPQPSNIPSAVLSISTPASTESPAPTEGPAPVASATSPAPTYTPGGPFPVGIYEPIRVLYINKLEFREDGTFRYTLDGGGAVSGTYVLDSNQIVLNESQIGPCAGFPGTYKWSFDGNTLYLKAIEDKCPLPHKLPLQRGWVKQP